MCVSQVRKPRLLEMQQCVQGKWREQGFTLDFSEARARVLNDCTILPFINNSSSTLSLEQPPVLPRTAFISSNCLSSLYYVSALLTHHLVKSLQPTFPVGILSPILQMTKLQFRELKKLLQSRSATKQKNLDSIFVWWLQNQGETGVCHCDLQRSSREEAASVHDLVRTRPG